MKKSKEIITLLLSATLLFGPSISSIDACTRIFMNQFPEHLVVGRNLDFFGPADPSLVITPQGIERNGGSDKNAMKWVSRYGSVAIYADDVFPMDGINEKGLSGHTQFYISDSQVQADNLDKPVLETEAWLSYILDNFATVNEAVHALQNDVRLVAVRLPIDYASDTKHIAIEDKTGDSAILEIDNGKVNIYHDRSYTVMTNPPAYPKQLEHLETYKNSSFDKLPTDPSPESRFVRASALLKNLPKPENKSQAQGFVLSTLANVARPIGYPDETADKVIYYIYGIYSKQPEYNKGTATYWTTVSDLTDGEYHFKTILAPSEVYLSLKEIDFSKGNSVLRIPHLHTYAEQGWEGNILSKAKAL